MSPPPLGVLFGALRSVGSLVAAVLVMMGFLYWGYLVAIFFDFFFSYFVRVSWGFWGSDRKNLSAGLDTAKIVCP